MAPHSQSAPVRYRIGDLVVDAGARQVTRGNETLKLGALTFDFLLALAEAAPDLVTHDELAERVWQGRPVTPETITQRAKMLRSSLSDNVREPRYVELLRGQGYRLVVEVERLKPASVATAQARFLSFAAAAAVAVGAFVFVGLAQLRDDPPPSVAVLPFADLSPGGDQAHLADGIAEELINALADLDGLHVASRTSSFSFRDSDEDLRLIADKLGVAAILEGSVQKLDDDIRITVQLVETDKGFHLWSETFDRNLNDIFAIQDEIATAAAGALGVKLGVGGANAFRGAGTTNFAAYEAYLRRDFARAVELDPLYAEAWGRLGVRTVSEMWNHPTEHAPRIVEQAYPYVRRAVELDPDSARALSSYATLIYARMEWLEAEQAYAKSLSLRRDRPNLAQYAHMLMRTGRIERSLAIQREADAIERLPRGPSRLRNFANIAAGDFEAAREMAARLSEQRRLDANVLIALNEGSIDSVRKSFEAMPVTEPAKVDLYAPLLDVLDAPDEALAVVRAVLDDPDKIWPDKYHDIALVAAYFGDAELALEAFDREIPLTAIRFTALWYPVMAEARQLPFFKQLVREARLVEYWRAHGWADLCRPLGDDDFDCQ